MIVVDLLVDGTELAQRTQVDNALGIGVLVAHVGLEGDSLDAGVGAKLTLVLPLACVAHFVPPQGVVVPSGIRAYVASGKENSMATHIRAPHFSLCGVWTHPSLATTT